MKPSKRACIARYKEIPIADLVIDKGLVRVRDVSDGIEELARSIQSLGLLQPILVCPARKRGKYQIIAGQRRFLAYRFLRKKKIVAAVLDRRVDETAARIYSLTENLVRGARTVSDVCCPA